MDEKIKTFLDRPHSWSNHNSFAYNPEQWFSSYILNIKTSSPAMEFGNEIGGKLATDTTFLPTVPRQSHMEYKIATKLGKIKLIGYLDSYDPIKKMMEEYKTSANVNKWNQSSVDTHGQLDYYCMLLWLSEKVKPEDVKIRLHWIPVATDSFFAMHVSGEPQSFCTSRTVKQVFALMVEIQKRRKKMEAYAKKRLLELSPT